MGKSNRSQQGNRAQLVNRAHQVNGANQVNRAKEIGLTKVLGLIRTWLNLFRLVVTLVPSISHIVETTWVTSIYRIAELWGN